MMCETDFFACRPFSKGKLAEIGSFVMQMTI